MPSSEVLKKLEALASKFGQRHLLQSAASWSETQARHLLETLESLPSDTLLKQREALATAKHIKNVYEPFGEYEIHKNSRKAASSKIACVILAGGQGTRLGWSGPKALFPILPGKTLLQIHLENYSSSNPLAIMCSPLNVKEIKDAVDPRVPLCVQDLLPLLDSDENWFLEAPGHLALGPDGNGNVFHNLSRDGILEQWEQKGIEHIVVIPIDNPLARPLDPGLVDFHLSHDGEVTIACVRRDDPFENVGVLARCGGKTCVVEYSEIDEELRSTRNDDGSLVLPLANINIFMFRFSFVKKKITFPWHAAKKKARSWPSGQEIDAWKLETFLFDALAHVNGAAALVYERDDMYSPLKNATGDRSPETVRAALLKNRFGPGRGHEKGQIT